MPSMSMISTIVSRPQNIITTIKRQKKMYRTTTTTAAAAAATERESKINFGTTVAG